MTEASPSMPILTPEERSQSRFAATSAWAAVAGAAALGVLISGLSWFAAGANLGLFLGTLLLLPLVAPVMLTRFRWLSPAGLWVGVAIVWLVSTTNPSIYFADVVRCLAVIAALLLAMAGLMRALCFFNVPPAVASAVITIVTLVWITWPVWMVEGLEGPHAQALVGLLTPVSPGFAINGAMPHFDAWDHYPRLAYTTLTVLNQDVSYRLPHSVAPTVALHALLGLLLFLPGQPRRSVT